MDETHESNANPSPGAETGETSGSDIAAEFIALGKNLKEIFQTAWESEERKKIQREIETALSEVITSLNQTANEIKESPAGQRLKTDVDDLRSRVQTGEVGDQIRAELLAALRKVNIELEKAASPKDEPPVSGHDAPSAEV
jgi:seryl-tRNA(Sec) selenium transferase